MFKVGVFILSFVVIMIFYFILIILLFEFSCSGWIGVRGGNRSREKLVRKLLVI